MNPNLHFGDVDSQQTSFFLLLEGEVPILSHSLLLYIHTTDTDTESGMRFFLLRGRFGADIALRCVSNL